MNPYREPPAPVESEHVVFLPRAYGGPVNRGNFFYFVAGIPLVFGVPQLVRALADGARDWTLLGWLVALLLLPVFVTRGWVRGSILISAQSIRRVGFLRERVTTWEQLSEGAGTVGNELERAQLFVQDRSGMLGWTLDAAREGRFAEIAQRVHAEGRALRRWRWYVPATVAVLGFALLFSVRPVLAMRRAAASVRYSAEVAECMAAISGTDTTREALRVLCLTPSDAP